ncbi:MAG: NACHT domain-containing protein [Chloroflexota bacterium]
MSFAIDAYSFIVGFITASVLWWLVGRSRPLLAELKETLQAQREALLARRTSGTEDNHRHITLRRAQGMHLAAPLFALDEIIQEPLLIAPPPELQPGAPPIAEDVVTQSLPYLPTWPELAAYYQAPALTLPEALAGGRNLVLVGLPGVGKTVALAHLATLSANRDASLGPLQEHIPFLVHVADLKLPVADARDVLEPIIAVVESTAPVFDRSRMPDLVELAFQSRRALLLLDGFDELTAEGQGMVTEYLKLLLKAHPQARIVTTGSFETLQGLLGLDFAALSMMTWSSRRARIFTQQWGNLWSKYVTVEAWAQTASKQVDPLLLNAWLEQGSVHLTPLEWTLKVWGAYAGDLRGPKVLDAINGHIRRLAPPNTPPAALETLALQVVLNSQPVFEQRKARQWISQFEALEETPLEETAPPLQEDDLPAEENAARKKPAKDGRAPKTPQPSAPPQGLLNKMAASGLLSQHLNNRMRFAHPIFETFLAGRALGDSKGSGDAILDQPDWLGKTSSLHYLAAHGDISRIVTTLLGWSRLPMHRPMLMAARWLKDAPRDAAWRGKLMEALVGLLQTEGLPLSLRGQALAAIALSNDPGAAALFRQLAAASPSDLVRLCALGSGAVKDTKAVQPLELALQSPVATVRQAASLALVAIGTSAALELVARALLGGDENLRQASAEALANDPGEGYAMLREGATLEDILLRRAVVYGLARVDEPWAEKLLESMRIEDNQWVVRNSASEVLDRKTKLNPRAPRPLLPPSETPWLIQFAGKQGMGISPGAPATDLLLGILKGDDAVARLACLPYLKKTPSEGVVTQLYHAMYRDDPELREGVYLVLMEMAAAGVKLPHPSQFGLG